MDLKAQQDGFETGVPTYNKEKSTLESTSGKSLNELNLNYAQRLVLISNNSDNPEVHPETKTEDIPFDTKREFDPDLKPGEERVVQKGEKGTKTITTPTLINPITGEKVGEGKPTEKITKEPIDQVVEYGPNKEYPSNPNKPGKPEQPTNNENNKSGDHQSSHSSSDKKQLPDYW